MTSAEAKKLYKIVDKGKDLPKEELYEATSSYFTGELALKWKLLVLGGLNEAGQVIRPIPYSSLMAYVRGFTKESK